MFLLRLIIFLFLSSSAAAQSRTWLHYDIGLSWDRDERKIGIPDFLISNGRNTLFGGFIEQEFGRCFSVETGIASRFCAFDALYVGSDTSDIIAAADYLQIPLRIKVRLPLIREKLSLVPRLGLSYLWLSKGGYNRIAKWQDNDLDLRVLMNFRRNFLLAESGMALEYQFAKNWKAALDISRYFSPGTKRLIAEYEVPNKHISQKIYGGYLAVQVRIGIAISSIWE